jgi:multidrug efflux pump subunit AcrA (membrane-fusion protein)
MPAPTVGESLSTTIGNLTDLIHALPDSPQRDALIAQQRTLINQLQALIDNTVPDDTAQYRAATASLQTANAALVAARQDIAKVAQVITTIAQVVGVIGELAASVK